MHYHSYIHIDVLVTIGLQEGYYSILESSNLVQVCVEVISGEIVDRSIAIEYATLDGSAEGINTPLLKVCESLLNIYCNESQQQNEYFQQCSAKDY